MNAQNYLNRHSGALTRLFLLSFVLFYGCNNSEPDAYSGSKCYEGTVIRAFCPSIAIVTVTNANIGTDWTFEGKNYKNAVSILNFPDSGVTTNNQNVYFTIDIDAVNRGDKCYLEVPCLQWAYDQSAPETSLCVKKINNQTCIDI